VDFHNEGDGKTDDLRAALPGSIRLLESSNAFIIRSTSNVFTGNRIGLEFFKGRRVPHSAELRNRKASRKAWPRLAQSWFIRGNLPTTTDSQLEVIKVINRSKKLASHYHNTGRRALSKN
jgi:hypothetical protein